jgi:hypothetical protein
MVFCVTLSFVRQHRATTLRCKQDGFATPSEELICARLIFLFQLGYADFAKEKRYREVVCSKVHPVLARNMDLLYLIRFIDFLVEV